MDQIRIGIVGYGNLGRGVEYALRQNPDMALVGVFTRRPPSSLTLQTPGVPVYPLDALDGMEGAVDVLLLCGGSVADLPEQSPRYAGRFHLVDSFDTHANIPAHFAAVDAAARAGGKTAIISAGWDPGLFSLVRALAAAVLPCGESYTFWGRGVSQGHSDAVRRHPRRPGRAAVHHPGPRRPGCGAQRRQSGADHPAEAHAGVLCGGGGGGRPGPHRAGDHHHAPLLCRLRHHGALSL